MAAPCDCEVVTVHAAGHAVTLRSGEGIGAAGAYRD